MAGAVVHRLSFDQSSAGSAIYPVQAAGLRDADAGAQLPTGDSHGFFNSVPQECVFEVCPWLLQNYLSAANQQGHDFVAKCGTTSCRPFYAVTRESCAQTAGAALCVIRCRAILSAVSSISCRGFNPALRGSTRWQQYFVSGV